MGGDGTPVLLGVADPEGNPAESPHGDADPAGVGPALAPQQYRDFDLLSAGSKGQPRATISIGGVERKQDVRLSRTNQEGRRERPEQSVTIAFVL